jgi:ferric-dicitrate binding protein FerR (iron transport regulator)
MEIDKNRLTRYFLGQCDADEKEAIGRWMEADEAHRQLFVRERIRFDASLMVDEQALSASVRPYRLGSLAGRVLRAAAVVLLVLAGSSYLFSVYQANRGATLFSQHVYVPAGNRASVTLPDGSLVWLNSNTSLTYPNVFSDKERTVELDGEAYFEVVDDSRKPFRVKTGQYHIEVLGTTFNVEAYAGKPGFKTALFTGKVKLYKDPDEAPLYLHTGETAVLEGDALVVSTTDFNGYRWRDGLIVIENNSFEEIVLLFEKYFGQQIIIRNEKVKDLGYRGKLRIADGVDHALRVLQNDFHFTYQREEDTNTIYIY